MADLDSPTPRHGHFATALQERHTALLGMWLFLATEVAMFGGLFMAVVVYRVTQSAAMHAAARELDMVLGGANTAILLTSSMTMALAVLAARGAARGPAVAQLIATAALGLLFLLVKAYEYAREYAEGLMPHVGPAFPLEPRQTELFFNFYFAATGLHAVHLAIGIGLVLTMAVRVAARRVALPAQVIQLECTGLYWHFVDVVWVFLYPALYLAGR